MKTKLRNIVFLEDNDALPALECLAFYGKESAIEYLKEYDDDDDDDDTENSEEDSDTQFEVSGNLLLTVNPMLGYISLDEIKTVKE